jgi:hypothetical protein
MIIIPVIYQGPGKYGDFVWMINRHEYIDSLFIFNDNIESKHSYKNGKGNAAIRKYNINNPNIIIPRSAGIPTGSLRYKGFQELNPSTKKLIDDAIEVIKKLIQTHKYNKIFYSAEPSGLLGQSLFQIDKKVIQYITTEICKLNSINNVL